MNNYLFLGLLLGAAIVAGVVMYMAAPKDDILFDTGITPQSNIQTKLQQDYYKGLIDRAGNPINKTNTTAGNYTLPKIQIPTSHFSKAAYMYDLANEEEKYEPWALRQY